MAVFNCDDCGKPTNSVASASYHTRFMEELWPSEFIGKSLCYGCGPKTYLDGEVVEIPWILKEEQPNDQAK